VDELRNILEKLEDLIDEEASSVSCQTVAFVDMLAKFYDYTEFKIEALQMEKQDYDTLKERLTKELSQAMKKTNVNSDKFK
jgi:hypothetical protein